MIAPFLGFGPDALAWFKGLEADNSKAYFTERKPLWQAQVRDPLESLLEELAQDLGGSVKMFRPHRDVRFSKDKSPYKSHTYGVVRVPGSHSGLYVSVSSKGLGAGSGYWQMSKDQLQRYRDAVQGPDGPALEKAMAGMKAAGLRTWGDALKTAPRGIAKDHPLIDLLRLKEVLAGADLDPADTLDGRKPKAFARDTWDRTRAVMAWMDARVGPAATPDLRFGRSP